MNYQGGSSSKKKNITQIWRCCLKSFTPQNSYFFKNLIRYRDKRLRPFFFAYILTLQWDFFNLGKLCRTVLYVYIKLHFICFTCVNWITTKLNIHSTQLGSVLLSAAECNQTNLLNDEKKNKKQNNIRENK